MISFKHIVLVSVMVIGTLANKRPYVPSYKPSYPAYKYEDAPLCSKNTTKPWCLEDSDYPAYDIKYALDEHYQTVLALYKDVAANTENSVDGLRNLSEETYLCPSTTDYVQPFRAVNVEGKWRVIVNRVESYGQKFTQTARVEECDTAVGSSCPLVPSCYSSQCVQKNVFHRFLVYDPYDYYFPFAIENFKLPASCGCVVGAFSH